MSRIAKAFERAKKENRTAIIVYYTVGFPSYNQSLEALTKFAQTVDIIELGIPFSDPLADGPTIQESSQIALEHKTNTEQAFEIAGKIREKSDTPLIAMTYYNLFYRLGLNKFAAEAKEAGIDGVIIPDLPPEEAGNWLEASKNKLETIFLAAPTSDNERLKKIGELSGSFVYAVSVAGVTGERAQLPDYLPAFVDKIKKLTGKKVAVGFGISTPEQVRQLASFANGVIVGSAIIRVMKNADNFDKGLKSSLALIEQYKQKGRIS